MSILTAILAKLRKDTAASWVAVLSLPESSAPEVMAGDFPLEGETRELLNSGPLGKLLRTGGFLGFPTTEGDPRAEHRLEPNSQYFLTAIALDHIDVTRYALVVGAEQSRRLRDISEIRMRAAAWEVSYHLARQRLDELLEANHVFLQRGFLAGSLVHEIRNEIQALDDYSAVQTLMLERSRREGRAPEEREFTEIDRSALRIGEIGKRLLELTTLFRHLAGVPLDEKLDLNQTVRHRVETIKPWAEHHAVTLDLDLEKEIPSLSLEARLVEQPILDLLIAGVERLATKKSYPRRLRIATAWQSTVEYPLIFSVGDPDPETVTRTWEKATESFPSAGTGLYVSRRLVESFGGRLRPGSAGAALVIDLPREVLV